MMDDLSSRSPEFPVTKYSRGYEAGYAAAREQAAALCDDPYSDYGPSFARAIRAMQPEPRKDVTS